MKDIAERMKRNYEEPARHMLTRRVPVIVRVDGKAFHAYTNGMERPFSWSLMSVMDTAALETAKEMQGFKIGYVQSDEASFLLTDYDTLQTEGWLGHVKSKIESIAASCMTAQFNASMGSGREGRLAMFDARAFNIPREEVINYFLWRAMDWERNSISMYCGSLYPHKKMHGKGKADQHEMLHAKGKNWTTDLGDRDRNGAWLLRDGSSRSDIRPFYAEIAEVVDPLLAEQATIAERMAATCPAR